MNTKLGIGIATTALALLNGCASDTSGTGNSAEALRCQGINECRGTSECASATDANACQGMNECRGMGWVSVDSVDDCESAGGTIIAAES